MDSSSSITPPSFKYDVCLSFSDEDTLFGFTSHLYTALREKQIEVHMNSGLGELISRDFVKATKESKVSVIIFTKNYAASIRCLEVLVRILECKELYKQIVIPVFYDIDPADVRRQTGSFADAFKQHEEDEFNGYRSVVLQRWREALTEAGNLSGFDLRDFKSEYELIQTIVEDIWNRLNDMPLRSSENTHTVDIREEDSGHEDEEAIEVPKVSLMINYNQSRRPATHTVDIREEDSGHEDEEAIQVPKITVERMFVASNLILEIPSAVFDQLSSPRYALASMLMSLTTMLICIIELAYKGGEARVGWRWGKKKKIPWFYYPSPSDKPFGTVTDFIGLLCSFFQCIFSVTYYVFYLRNINYPIKISLWPLVFAFCLLCSTFSKKSPRTPKKDALL